MKKMLGPVGRARFQSHNLRNGLSLPIYTDRKLSIIQPEKGAPVKPGNAIITILAPILFLGTPVAVQPAGANTSPGEVSAPDKETIVVDEDDFQGRHLVWSYFQALAERDDVMIIDVRSDFLPAAGDPPGLNNVRPIPLEIFLPNFAARKVHQDKTLLIFDESGLELRRLQYHLQKHGYDDYFFLEGGAEGLLSTKNNRS
jgi:rhodanese-related sulfurtransferase